MNCNHDEIVSFYSTEGQGGPIMWACNKCWHKFVPMDQLMQEVANEREACAKVCEELNAWNEDDPGSSAAAAIRARGYDLNQLLDAQWLSSKRPPLKKGEV